MRPRRALLLTALLLAASVAALPHVARAQAPEDSATLAGHLYWPTDKYWKSRAPDSAFVDIATSRGTITVLLKRAWAPNGVDRAYNLARAGYYNDSRFYRVVEGFVAQFGLAGNPDIASAWANQLLPADARKTANVRGTVTFAQFKPEDRTVNLFINLRDNPRLDALGFAPVGRVVKGMAIADQLYAGYGEKPMAAANTKRLYAEGNRFLDAKYPKLTRIRKVTVR